MAGMFHNSELFNFVLFVYLSTAKGGVSGRSSVQQKQVIGVLM